MKFKFAAFSLIFGCLLCSFNFHPVNMSVGDITYSDKKLNLKFKFFTDNMETILKKYCRISVDMETTGYDSNTEKCLQQYIAARFEMSINGIPCKWIYKKGTLNRNVLIIEYELPYKPTKLKSVKIKNILLFDDNFPEMKNIMNINLFNTLKVLEFDHDEAVLTGNNVQEIKY